jgi:NADH:ubiquinone reductase (H+-translocating)
MAQRPRVVVVGSGFGGFFAARRLGRAGLDLTILSAVDGLLYAPLLPEVAAGGVDPRSAVVPLAGTLTGIRIVRGHASGIDLADRVVRYEGAEGEAGELSYDRLLLAPGSVTRLPDIPGLAEHAIGLKTVTEALYLRDHLLGRIEAASAMTDGARRRAALTFLVAGAGYAGVELTAQLARLTRQLLPLYPRIRRDDVHWLLVDVAKAVMPELGSSLGDSALALLQRRAVDVRLGVSVQEATDSTVTLTDGTVLDCATLIWCAGVTASPLIGTLGLPTGKGRLVVTTRLQVPGHPEVYAIGDAAAVPDLTKPPGDGGQPPVCPPTAQHAMRQATAASRNILASLSGGEIRPYRHRDLGLVVDLGGPDAAATPLGRPLRGRLAKVVTRGYHLYALPTARRRIRVGLDWALAAGHAPDDVSLGMMPERAALVTQAEHES